MATKSITKDIRVKDKMLGESLAAALENAKNKKCRLVDFQRSPQTMKKEDIFKYFGGKSK